MAGRRQKPHDQLQDRRPGRGGVALTLAGTDVDVAKALPMPRGLQKGAQKRWRGLLRSPVAEVIDPEADAEALYRWIHCVSERERLQPKADAAPLVLGSVGQMVPNPLYAVIQRLSREIARAEDHFGMTSLSRVRLGIGVLRREAGREELLRQLNDRRAREAAGSGSGDVRPGEDGVIDLDRIAPQ